MEDNLTQITNKTAMRNLLILGASVLSLLMFWGYTTEQEDGLQAYPQKLSEYGFFTGNIADLKPAQGIEGYTLNAPLFSDYAHKARHFKLPAGTKMEISDKGELLFPLGTMLIKTFFYPEDFRKPEGKRRLTETRVLTLDEKGWIPLNYIWNEAQTEAVLDVGSHDVPVAWIDEKGEKKELTYAVPNLSLCKSCHVHGRKLVPLGPIVKQLNLTNTQGKNQLEDWVARGLLNPLPDKVDNLPTMAQVYNPKSGTTEQRARAWLDANCAHCHKKSGAAQISGLLLNTEIEEPAVYGVNKVPMSTSLANEQYPFDIVPGHPEKSLLIYRIISDDPGIRMPKVACQIYDKEGVELLKDWIKNMKG